MVEYDNSCEIISDVGGEDDSVSGPREVEDHCTSEESDKGGVSGAIPVIASTTARALFYPTLLYK